VLSLIPYTIKLHLNNVHVIIYWIIWYYSRNVFIFNIAIYKSGSDSRLLVQPIILFAYFVQYQHCNIVVICKYKSRKRLFSDLILHRIRFISTRLHDMHYLTYLCAWYAFLSLFFLCVFPLCISCINHYIIKLILSG